MPLVSFMHNHVFLIYICPSTVQYFLKSLIKLIFRRSNASMSWMSFQKSCIHVEPKWRFVYYIIASAHASLATFARLWAWCLACDYPIASLWLHHLARKWTSLAKSDLQTRHARERASVIRRRMAAQRSRERKEKCCWKATWTVS